MATTKITDLTAYTDPVNTDVLPIVDVTSDVTKKVSIANVMKNASLGTAALPGIAFDGDPNTGIYSPGADQVAITTGGTARLTSSTTAVTSALPIDHPLGSAATPTVTFTGDLNTGIYSPGADQVAISTNGTGRLFVDSTGRVGVGTSSVEANVDIVGSRSTSANNTITDAALRTRSTSGGLENFAIRHRGASNGISGLQYVSQLIDSGSNGMEIYTAGSTPVVFGTNATERLRITSAGNVGVGTSSVSTKLEIAGNNDAVTENNTLRFTDTDASTEANQQIGKIEFYSSDASTPGAGVKAYIGAFAADTTPDAYLAFATQDGSVVSTPVERVRITSDGKVGIGTTSASALCHVYGGNSANSLPSNTQAIFENSANGGIAISTPSGNAAGAYFPRSTDAFYAGIERSGTDLNLRNNGSTRATIDSSGRLLVGTSTGTSVFFGVTPQLQVEGTNENTSSLSVFNNQNSATGAYIAIGKSRGTSTGSSTIVNSGDAIGGIYWVGADGTDRNTPAAQINCEVDGTPGANDMPGRLVFSTTADGASSPTERMRISSNGAITGNANFANDYSFTTNNDGNNSNRYGLRVRCGTYDATGTNYAVSIEDGNGDNQGYITFTSGTVTYGAFTAHHPCILPEADNAAGYPYGTLLEIINIEYTQKDGKDTERGILYNVRKTQAANSRAVLGAYGSSMNGGPSGETNRHQALVLGDGHILCNNSGGNIKVGDGICSSATPGIGQKATATPSMAIGIAQEDVIFADDEEVKLVAVQYGVRQFIPWGD